MSYPINYFKNKNAKRKADMEGLVDVENGDLTLDGLVAKAKEWNETEHGIDADAYDDLKKDMAKKGGKIPANIKRLGENKMNEGGKYNLSRLNKLSAHLKPFRIKFEKFYKGSGKGWLTATIKYDDKNFNYMIIPDDKQIKSARISPINLEDKLRTKDYVAIKENSLKELEFADKDEFTKYSEKHEVRPNTVVTVSGQKTKAGDVTGAKQKPKFRITSPIPKKFKKALDDGLPVAKKMKLVSVGKPVSKGKEGLEFRFSDKTDAQKFAKYMQQQGHKTVLDLQFSGNNTVMIKENIQQGENTMIKEVSAAQEKKFENAIKSALAVVYPDATSMARAIMKANPQIDRDDAWKIAYGFEGHAIKNKKNENNQLGENTMKIKMSELKGLIKEVLAEETNEYQQFFKDALEKFGAKSPADLGDKKDEFFSYVEKNWKGKSECKDEKIKKETLEPVSQAAGEPEYNPTKRLKAKKRDQIVAKESKEVQKVRQLVREELKFVMFNEIPGGLSRKRAKKRVTQIGSAETNKAI